MQTVPRRNGRHNPGAFHVERHRALLAYTDSDRNSYAHSNAYARLQSYARRESVRNRGSRCHCGSQCHRDSGAFAASFTNPISGTKASRSFDGDRAATRRVAFSQCFPFSGGLAQGRRRAVASSF
jgi:hypothetical protein